MAAKCGPAVPNLSAMAVEVVVSGRFGEPAGGPEARIHQKNTNPITNRAILLHESWPDLGWAGLGWPGLARAGLGWAELAWACLAWPGLAWAGLSWVEGAPCGSNLSAMASKRGAEMPKATCFTACANADPR